MQCSTLERFGQEFMVIILPPRSDLCIIQRGDDMKRNKRLLIYTVSTSIIFIFLLAGCSNSPPGSDSLPADSPETPEPLPAPAVAEPVESAIPIIMETENDTGNSSADLYQVNQYDDIRGGVVGNDKDLYTSDLRDFGAEMYTLTFNNDTMWPDGGNMPVEERFQPGYILENGKNPGLGVRSLHERGITGNGISVAIIDQAMPVDHPEYNGKIVKYVDLGMGSFSLHGPAVTSLLVGENAGTAPGARVYYFSAERLIDGRPDASAYAEAVDQIIDINNSLPDSEKIRVISISASPTPSYDVWINGEQYLDSVTRAQEAGILVLDCSMEHGFIRACSYSFEDPDDITLCRPGFLDTPAWMWMPSPNYILAPVSYRTIAEVYADGVFSYAYFGLGGLSWGIPYAAGVLAMGWEVNPELKPDEIVDILFSTAYVDNNGNHYIYPTAFIDYLQNTLHD